MNESAKRRSARLVVWKQLLVGQTFGVCFAVLLFLAEPVRQVSAVYGDFGASLAAILAVYTAFGWVAGVVAGGIAALIGGICKRAVNEIGTVFGVGPLLGFVFTAMYITRMQSAIALRSFPSTFAAPIVAAALAWVGLGYAARKILARYVPTGARTVALNVLAVAAFSTAAGLLGLTVWESKRLPGRAVRSVDSPNIVLIVVGSLRPDHLSVYGYDRDTSPNLERFAGSATVFENAYSHGTQPVFSMPSLFTSLYPSFITAAEFGNARGALSESYTTVADICVDAGYTTVGLMSSIYLRKPFGLTQGFDHVEEFDNRYLFFSVYRVLTALGVVAKAKYPSFAPNGADVTDAGIEWLRRLENRPFFMFLHYTDVDAPYYPPDGYERLFVAEGEDIDPMILFMETEALVRKKAALDVSEAELRRLTDLYDDCVRYTDGEIGRFLMALGSTDNDRETIVLVTADHGEEFLEHGSLYHGNLAVEPLLRVPLIIGRCRTPAGSNRVKSMVRHIDILPTIAGLAGADVPESVHGASLLPLLEKTNVPVADYTVGESEYSTSLNMGGWKILYVDSTRTYSLNDLSDDPLGLIDVSDEYPDKSAEMRAVIDGYFDAVARRRVEVVGRAGAGEADNIRKRNAREDDE